MQFSHCVDSIGPVPIESWCILFHRAWQCGNFIIVDETAFARDFGVFDADTALIFCARDIPRHAAPGSATAIEFPGRVDIPLSRMKPTSATGTAWEPTPWRATQRAAWEALRRLS